MSILHKVAPHQSVHEARLHKLKIIAALVLVTVVFVFWRGVEFGKMLALKDAYKVYKSQVPWECS